MSATARHPFEFLDDRLRVAVEAAAAAGQDPNDSLRGLYISDEQAIALSETGSRIEANAQLAAVAERLELDALDATVLAVCCAPELQPRYGRLYAYLNDDVTRKLPTPRLVASLVAGQGVEATDVLGCFAGSAPLMRLGALHLLTGDDATALADRPIKCSARLAAHLLGASGLADSAANTRLRRAHPSGAFGRGETVERLAFLLGARTRLPLVVSGPDAASAIARAADRMIVLLDAGELQRQHVMQDASLAARLESGLLCIDGIDDLTPPDRSLLLRTIAESDERLILIASSPRGVVAVSDLTVLSVEVPSPNLAERSAVWDEQSGASNSREVAAKFRLSVDQIRAAAEVSTIAANARGDTTPSPADLDLGARHASSSRLGELATQLQPGWRFADLVLPERQLDLLRSISAYLRHRDRVLSEWGYEQKVSTQGLKVLFAGESGTGKTMAAQVLGAELGLDLFRVDLATVVSKYIGETEKNLERIFTAADGSNAILFFDEADALFGKRSEVSDSHDRYANIEVAYLLQRMEAYPGAVILATNFRRNIDDAFIRRLDFVIDFPFPEAEDRRRIWRLVLPAAAPVAEDIDLDFLANQFKLSGGAIRNCSLAAAFRAADEDGRIEMRHLVQAVALEYGKQGRLTLEADFHKFHPLVRREGS